jgi:hypothetical protein
MNELLATTIFFSPVFLRIMYPLQHIFVRKKKHTNNSATACLRQQYGLSYHGHGLPHWQQADQHILKKTHKDNTSALTSVSKKDIAKTTKIDSDARRLRPVDWAVLQQ